MPIRFDFEKSEQIIYVYCTGVLTSHEVIEFYEKLVEEKIFRQGTIEVVDLCMVEDFILHYSDIAAVGSMAKTAGLLGHKGTIIFGYTDVSKGIISMISPLFFQTTSFPVFTCSTEDQLKVAINAVKHE